MLSEDKKRELIKKAWDATEYSYVPYSEFAVGAALLTKDGKIYTGCNIENIAYGPSNCAERTAFFKSISEGDTEFSAIAVVGKRKDQLENLDFTPPCGVCRQVMLEFCDPKTFEIILGNSKEEAKIFTLEEMLPHSFGSF